MPHPNGRTILLSAGPRAGKTTQLFRWRDEATGPSHFLQVTEEDRIPGFLIRRFLSSWPGIDARFKALRDALPAASWGGLLGLAIAEEHPTFSLFIDNFHLTEEMPDAAEWTSLLQHFPEGGTLAVASRHQLPAIGRAPCERVDVDDPRWNESPSRADLLALPQAIASRVLAIQAVGEGTPCGQSDELVRRNLVTRDANGLLKLRPAWQPVAQEALGFSDVGQDVWLAIERELHAFRLRHIGSRQEEQVASILDRIPSSVRRGRSALMAHEGMLRQRAHRFDEALACFQRAMDLAQTLEERLEARLGLMNAASRLRKADVFDAAYEALRIEADPTDTALMARMLFCRGTHHWFSGSASEAAEDMHAVLACPTQGNRQTVYFHAQALAHLSIHQIEFHHVSRSPGYAERYVRLCESYGFDRELLYTYSLSLHGLLLDEADPPPLCKLLAMPTKAFEPAQPDALCNYLLMFGIRAFYIGRHQVARRNFEMVLNFADSLSRDEVPLIARFWLLQVLGVLKVSERVRDHYEALHAARARTHFWENIQLSWVRSKIFAGDLEEAERLLRDTPWQVNDNRIRATLYQHWVGHLAGRPGVVEAASALVMSGEGAFLWHNEATLLQALGIRSVPPVFHLSTFGGTAFTRLGADAPRWPRKKALSLLAHLAMAPQGLEQGELIERLYEGSTTYDPASALYKLAYDLRKVLASVEADDLLGATRRTYRMDWGRVAHCDLHAFDALRAKGQELEAAGIHSLAAIFYWMALEEAPGSLFEDLDDPAFEQPRQVYDERISRMKTFVEAYAPHLNGRVLV